jgi:hypothetical protein
MGDIILTAFYRKTADVRNISEWRGPQSFVDLAKTVKDGRGRPMGDENTLLGRPVVLDEQCAPSFAGVPIDA